MAINGLQLLIRWPSLGISMPVEIVQQIRDMWIGDQAPMTTVVRNANAIAHCGIPNKSPPLKT